MVPEAKEIDILAALWALNRRAKRLRDHSSGYWAHGDRKRAGAYRGHPVIPPPSGSSPLCPVPIGDDISLIARYDGLLDRDPPLSVVDCFRAARIAGWDGGKGRWISRFNGKNLNGWSPKVRGYAPGGNDGETIRVEVGDLQDADDRKPEFDGRFGRLFRKAEFRPQPIRRHRDG